MGKEIQGLGQAYEILFAIVLVALAVLVVLCLVRAIMGPRVADRILAANMTGTMVIVMIAVLSLKLGEGYLADICIIYAMISFLAVIVLTKVYMGVYTEKRTETEAEAQSVTEEKAEPEAERASAAKAEPEAERASAAKAESETECLSAAKAGPETESLTAAKAEPETESLAAAKPETVGTAAAAAGEQAAESREVEHGSN